MARAAEPLTFNVVSRSISEVVAKTKTILFIHGSRGVDLSYEGPYHLFISTSTQHVKRHLPMVVFLSRAFFSLSHV